MEQANWRFRAVWLALVLASVLALLEIWRREKSLRQNRSSMRSLRVERQHLMAQLAQDPNERHEAATTLEEKKALIRDFGEKVHARQSRGTGTGPDLEPGLTPISSLLCEGQNTPLSTIHSVLWSLYNGNTDVLAKMITFTAEGRNAATKLFDHLSPGNQNELRTPEHMMALLFAYGYPAVGFAVSGDHQVGDMPDRWEVTATIELEDGRTVLPTYPLRQVDGYWMVEVDSKTIQWFGRPLGDLGVSASSSGQRSSPN